MEWLSKSVNIFKYSNSTLVWSLYNEVDTLLLIKIGIGTPHF